MKVRTLRPIYPTGKDQARLERELVKIFRSEIYAPLLGMLKRPRKNSLQDLEQALLDGHVRYDTNGFVGVFSATISRELRKLGAVYSKRGFKYLIRLEALPGTIQDAVRQAELRDERLKQTVTQRLDELQNVEIKDSFASVFEHVTDDFERRFKDSVRSITIPANISPVAKDRIATEYSNNLRLFVRDFADEQIKSLRKQVEEHTFQGDRYEDLKKTIKASYGVAERKARFLARQETNLLVAKLKETRYADAGIDEYYWVSVTGTTEHPVRPLHKELNARSAKGEVFKFSSPPVSGTKGERQNPGEPFNCRCVARPIVRFK